jgi:3-hydroxy-9,10-secoandrosta-1,3,5(10)-triene-9,17-dione monooxygenase reductase component
VASARRAEEVLDEPRARRPGHAKWRVRTGGLSGGDSRSSPYRVVDVPWRRRAAGRVAPWHPSTARTLKKSWVTTSPGIVVVTAMTKEGPAGFTCQTFGSLSIDSALVFFAAITTSPSWQRVRQAGVLGINILSDDQEHLARGSPSAGRQVCRTSPWVKAPNGSPFLEGAHAYWRGPFARSPTTATTTSSWRSWITPPPSRADPLAYYRGGYRVLGSR